jgi:hypothetical protein
MRQRLLGGVLALAALAGAVLVGPARADTNTYDIAFGFAPNARCAGCTYGGYDARGSVTETAWSNTGCDSSRTLSGPTSVQGFDAYVLPAAAMAGKPVTVTWTAESASGRSYVNFYGQWCNWFGATRSDPWNAAEGAKVMTFTGHPSLRWIVLTTENARNVKVTVSY